MRTGMRWTDSCRLVVLGVGLWASASACGDSGTQAHSSGGRKVLVETAAPTIEDVATSIRAVGTVKASEHAEIRAQVEGIVAEVSFIEGALVERGEVLMRLDDRKARASRALSEASLDRARAHRTVAEQRLARHKRLIAEELIAEETFEEALAEYRSAEAEVRESEAALDLATTQLEDYQIDAPFAGRVGARLVDVGNFVEKGTPLTNIVQTDPIEIEFGIADRLAAEVAPGAKVGISVPGSEPTTGTIAFINPRVDATTRLLKLKARADNSDGRLRPGQFVEIEIVTSLRRGQTVIPEQAVMPADGKTWVFVVHDAKAERREVTLGTRLPRRVEVLSGLGPESRVVVSGQHRLTDGDNIEIIDPAPGVETVRGGDEAPRT